MWVSWSRIFQEERIDCSNAWRQGHAVNSIYSKKTHEAGVERPNGKPGVKMTREVMVGGADQVRSNGPPLGYFGFFTG